MTSREDRDPNAPGAIGRVLDRPPDLVPEVLRGDTRLTRRWRHGALHDSEQAIDLPCTQLVRGHSTFGALASPAPRRGLADWQVRRVTGHMLERLDAEVGLDELAALAGLGRFHFCTSFRLATGHTPHEWPTARRVHRAQELLRDPGLRITDVALAVGYGTPSAFATAFRRLTGVTPTEFRRRL